MSLDLNLTFKLSTYSYLVENKTVPNTPTNCSQYLTNFL